MSDKKKKDQDKVKTQDHKYTEKEVDEAMKETFPASDAPAFNPGTTGEIDKEQFKKDKKKQTKK